MSRVKYIFKRVSKGGCSLEVKVEFQIVSDRWGPDHPDHPCRSVGSGDHLIYRIWHSMPPFLIICLIRGTSLKPLLSCLCLHGAKVELTEEDILKLDEHGVW